jgi:hypothetical protein
LVPQVSPRYASLTERIVAPRVERTVLTTTGRTDDGREHRNGPNQGPRAGLPPAGSAHHLNAVPLPGAPQALQTCAAKLSATFHTLITYQPASRYWTFQTLEPVIFAAAVLMLAGIAFWWLRHLVN